MPVTHYQGNNACRIVSLGSPPRHGENDRRKAQSRETPVSYPQTEISGNTNRLVKKNAPIHEARANTNK